MAKKLSKKTVTVLKKVVAKENRRVERANKAFEKMTPSQKRVQIARDVLAQLASKRLVATPGTWLSGKNESDLLKSTDFEKDTELQKVIGKTKQCTGCALGGMFMCAVERANKLKVGELSDDAQQSGNIEYDDVFKYMERFFSIDQLHDIESAFERGEGATSSEEGSEWLKEEEDASERMRLIMENIVVNKGRFDVYQEPDRHWTTPGFKG